MSQLPEPAAVREALRKVPKGAGEGELAVLLVNALPLAGSAQVVVRADAALVAGPHHRPVATITDHIGVHHVAGHLLRARGAVVPPALLLLFNVNTEDVILHIRHRHRQFLVTGKGNQVPVLIAVVRLEAAGP